MSYLALSALFEYLCYESTIISIFLLFQCGDRLDTSESDVMTFKVDPRAVRVNGMLTFHKYNVLCHFLSFEVGNCVSNSSFK